MSLDTLTVKNIRGKDVNLSDYQGHVILIVNTASKCGLTPQFAGLQELYNEYKEQGLVILGFPCNQFGNQDPGDNEEIEAFCEINYGVTFPMFAKIDVNGENEHPLYTWLKSEQGGIFGDKIKWNFTKFLLDRDGQVVKRFAPQTEPKDLTDAIEALL